MISCQQNYSRSKACYAICFYTFTKNNKNRRHSNDHCIQKIFHHAISACFNYIPFQCIALLTWFLVFWFTIAFINWPIYSHSTLLDEYFLFTCTPLILYPMHSFQKSCKNLLYLSLLWTQHKASQKLEGRIFSQRIRTQNLPKNPATAPLSIPMPPIMSIRSTNAHKNGISHYSCKRHFSDPDAHWGWDSDEGASCSHNTAIDLHLHIRFLDARRHDGVNAIVSLREFKTMNLDIPVKNLCLDSAHDNYATYGLCHNWEICPFIDLNINRGAPPLSRILAPLCTWPVSAWSTGATVNKSISINSTAHLSAAK